MPYGKMSEGHNTSGLSKQRKQAYNRTVADINQEAKRRIQKRVKATSQDGNKKSR